MSWQTCKGSEFLFKILYILVVLFNLAHCSLEDLEPTLDESKLNNLNLRKKFDKKQGHVIHYLTDNGLFITLAFILIF